MVLIERNHEIKALSARATDQAPIKCIRLGRFVRLLQHGHVQRLQGSVQLSGINAVTVVDEKPISLVAANTFRNC